MWNFRLKIIKISKKKFPLFKSASNWTSCSTVDEYSSYLLLLLLFLELLLWLFLWHSWQPTITWSLIKSVDKLLLGLRLNCSTSVELHWGQDSKWPRWVNTECEASEAPLWRRLEAMTSIHEILALHSNLEMNQNVIIYYFDTKTQHLTWENRHIVSKSSATLPRVRDVTV